MTSEPLNATAQVDMEKVVLDGNQQPETRVAAGVPVPTRQTKQVRIAPLRSAFEYAVTALAQLKRLRQSLYLASQGTAQGEVREWLSDVVVDSCRTLVELRSESHDWHERTQAGLCVTAAQPVTQDVGRYAYKLRHIVVEVVSSWVTPLRTPTSTKTSPDLPVLHTNRVFSSGPPPPEFLLGLLRYLEQIDLPGLAATADILVGQLKYRYIPTPRHCRTYEVIRRHGPLKKAALEKRLGVEGSDLYKLERCGLQELRRRGIVEHLPGLGYVVAAEMPAPSLVGPRRRSTSGPTRVASPKVTRPPRAPKTAPESPGQAAPNPVP